MIDIGTDKAGRSLRMLVTEALRHYPTSALFPFLNDRDVITRSAAAREIQIRGGKRAFGQTAGLLGDDNQQLREMACFILGQLGTPKLPFRSLSIAMLVKHLATEKHADAIAAALMSLGHLGATSQILKLAKFRQHPDPSVRAALIYAVALACAKADRTSESVTAIVKGLRKDRSSQVRRALRFAEGMIEHRS
jgi:HEAT repeat protein